MLAPWPFRSLVAASVMTVSLGFALAADDDESHFKPLFDGESLDGWVGDTDGYMVEDGAIASKPMSGGNLFTKDEFGDFALRFEFRLTPGANNGLGIRCPLEGNGAFDGMELQVIDDTSEKYKNIKVWQHHGSVYGVVPAKTGHLKPTGEWNQQEVIAQGRHVKVILNGATIVDADLDEASKNGTIDGREHPGLKRAKGHIGFLGHGARVDFRNIRVREL